MKTEEEIKDEDIKYYTDEEAFFKDIYDKAIKHAEEVIPQQIQDLEKEKKLNKWIANNAKKEMENKEDKTL